MREIRSSRNRLALVLALGVLPAVAWAGDTGDGAVGQSYRDARFTYVQWWEANRDTFLRRALQYGTPPAGLMAAVEQATPALTAATRGDAPEVRAEAALALARAGRGEDRLTELTADPDVRVRCYAWIGLGLLQCEEKLLKADHLAPPESLAVLHALALLDAPKRPVLERFRTVAAGDASAEARRVAVNGLRIYHARVGAAADAAAKADPKTPARADARKDRNADRDLLLKLLRETHSRSLACEVINTLGTVGDDNRPVLLDIVAAGRDTNGLPVSRDAVAHATAGGRPLILLPSPLDPYRCAACVALSDLTAAGNRTPAVATPAPSGPLFRQRLAVGDIFSYVALAFEPLTLRTEPNGYQTNCSGLSALALWRNGELTTASDLLNLRLPHYDPMLDDPQHPVFTTPARAEMERARTQREARKFYGHMPVREFAAIALGLADTNITQTPGLASMTADVTQEPAEFRAACALGVGLSGTGGDELVRAARQLKAAGDGLVCGHLVLALGLLRDTRALDVASDFGAPGADAIDPQKVLASRLDEALKAAAVPACGQVTRSDGTLARRAVVLGLGLTQDPRAKRALTASWGDDPWVSLEAARAMNWCGLYDAVGPFVTLVQQQKKPVVAAFAARSLGELLDPGRPSRLGRIVEGACFTHVVQPWTDALLDDGTVAFDPFAALSSPFLFDRLMPSAFLAMPPVVPSPPQRTNGRAR